MLLQPGITGFLGYKDKLPTIDLKSFKACCYAIVIAVEGRVLEFQPADYGKNFHHALLQVDAPRSRILVLLNQAYPLIAFADPISCNYCHLEFMDVPSLSKQFDRTKSGYEYKVLSKQELETAFNSVDEKLLTTILLAAEISQIRHWQPQRVGEIVFNFWD